MELYVLVLKYDSIQICSYCIEHFMWSTLEIYHKRQRHIIHSQTFSELRLCFDLGSGAITKLLVNAVTSFNVLLGPKTTGFGTVTTGPSVVFVSLKLGWRDSLINWHTQALLLRRLGSLVLPGAMASGDTISSQVSMGTAWLLLSWQALISFDTFPPLSVGS